MSSFEVHMKKHMLFQDDAENAANSEPTRVEAYFESAFHLIEAVCAKSRVHINKHQKTRLVLENSGKVFGEETGEVWRAFQEIENQIRPGQAYGGAIDGKALKRTRELFEKIVEISLRRGITERRKKGVS